MLSSFYHSSVWDVKYEYPDRLRGNGDERRKRLTEAGYDYDEIQKLVNEMLK